MDWDLYELGTINKRQAGQSTSKYNSVPLVGIFLKKKKKMYTFLKIKDYSVAHCICW